MNYFKNQQAIILHESSKIAYITWILMDKIAEIYIAERNSNFAKALLPLFLSINNLRCPTDLPILCFN